MDIDAIAVAECNAGQFRNECGNSIYRKWK